MSDSGRVCLVSLLKQVALIIVLAVLLAPSAAFSEPQLIFYDDAKSSLAAAREQHVTHPVTVGLNENGDLMIRGRDVSLTLAYSAPPSNDIIDLQERIRVAQRQDCPPISGISIKVSLLF